MMSPLKNLSQTRNWHGWLYYPDKDNTATQKEKKIVNPSLATAFVMIVLSMQTDVPYSLEAPRFHLCISAFMCAVGSSPRVKYSTKLIHSLQKHLKMLSLWLQSILSPRPTKKKQKKTFSRLSCTNKSECHWVSQLISPCPLPALSGGHRRSLCPLWL